MTLEDNIKNDTEFVIEIGQHKKGEYQRRMSFMGNLTKAIMWYNSFNIGNGYKKRLVMISDNERVVIGRHTSD
jgi:hypothetical protein